MAEKKASNGSESRHVESVSHQPELISNPPKESGWTSTHDRARAANAAEHSLTVRKAVLDHGWGVVWSLVISLSIIMEGYDTILIGSFYGYPAFRKQFGSFKPTTGYQVQGKWQSALGASGNVGALIGSFLNGWLIRYFGFKKVFRVSLLLMAGFVFISFFGKSVQLQVVGQLLSGYAPHIISLIHLTCFSNRPIKKLLGSFLTILASLPWGIFATLSPAYASEMLPMALRPYLTAYTNMCFAIGQFIGAGVLQSLESGAGQWSYRIPFAIQWLWPAPLFVLSFLMPESPWWLVRKDRFDDAETIVRRLTTGPEKDNARSIVAMMIHTNNIEREIEEGTSYWDCFKGSNYRRTEIACVCFAGQVLAGSQFAYSGTYFFEQAGMSPANAYKLSLGGTAIAFVGTILCWFLMNRCGYRTLYITGMGLMCIYLLVIGFLTLAPQNSYVEWSQSALTVVWLFTFSLTVGPMGWSIPPAVSSTRLRSKTICLARNTYYIAIIAANTIEPYMMNPTAWNWRGKTGFFWFSFAFCTFVWAFFRLTETKGRTFEELDIMFAAGIPTRKFKNFHVDAYAEDVLVDQHAVRAADSSKA